MVSVLTRLVPALRRSLVDFLHLVTGIQSSAFLHHTIISTLAVAVAL